MKLYEIICEQDTSMWSYTQDEPETAQQIRSHFWSYDECRTLFYKDFTLDYIRENWQVDFKPKYINKGVN